jgi:hypothetical protein
MATWKNELMQTPDPAQSGVIVCGIGGRIYLFGPEISCSVVGDGIVTVLLIDETSGTPVSREAWVFDPDTLKRSLRRDVIGWGYTLFLPSRTAYPPEMTQVRLKVCYQPLKGTPLYAESAVMTLNNREANAQGLPLTKKPGEAPATPAATATKPLIPPGPVTPAGAFQPAAPRAPGAPQAATTVIPPGPPVPWKS